MSEIKTVTIGLPVADIGSATKWYRRLLGSVEEINPVPDVWEFSLTPTCWLQLFEVEANEPNPSVVRFESNNIKESHELALKVGSAVTEIESVPGAVKYFEFRDPFGNSLSYYELLDE
ncbi:MAG: VOC family protein [Gammaproteobacteria bacterium]|nr:MAG: VOC family protein [Gammaproteobacteria bacterium]